MVLEDERLPRKFGTYKLKEKIARGGMAELYLAEVKGPGGFIKPVVIKMIHKSFSDDARFQTMFTDEARIVAGLTHGNIVPVIGFGDEAGVLYQAMEFIDGVDTSTLMETCRILGLPLELSVALWIGMGTAAGLAHAHQALDSNGTPMRIVHRDVSPHNILLSRSGEVKLCDFGLAAWASSEPADDHIRGKLSYLSPEQATGGVTDARSDVFSLGVVLYELIAGHHPIVAGTNVTVLHHLVEDKGYPLLRDAAPWIPEAVTKIIDRAIDFNPEKRFPSAEALGSELSKVLYTRFPDFTPQRLASLVIQIQSANEEWIGNDPNSQLRAKLASFASSRRGTSSMIHLPLRTQPSTRRRPLRLVLVTALVLVIASFSVVWLLARDRTNGRQPPLAEIEKNGKAPSEHAIKDEKKPLSTDEPDSELASGIIRGEKQPIPVEQPDASPKERPSTVSDRARADTRVTGKSKKISFGALDANASPWAEVSIDGRPPLTTPIIGHKLKVGQHRAIFTNPELEITVKREFTIKTNETTRIVVKME